MNYLDIIGSSMSNGFRFSFTTFDWGMTGAIGVEKNRRHAIRFRIRSHWNLKSRIALRKALDECKRVASVRYSPKKRSRWAP
jgi:hypothetical protein